MPSTPPFKFTLTPNLTLWLWLVNIILVVYVNTHNHLIHTHLGWDRSAPGLPSHKPSRASDPPPPPHWPNFCLMKVLGMQHPVFSIAEKLVESILPRSRILHCSSSLDKGSSRLAAFLRRLPWRHLEFSVSQALCSAAASLFTFLFMLITFPSSLSVILFFDLYSIVVLLLQFFKLFFNILFCEACSFAL